MRSFYWLRIVSIIVGFTATITVPWLVVQGYIYLNSAAKVQQSRGTIVITSKNEKTGDTEYKTSTEDEYLIGVLAAEVPASFQMEALKAQAIASRSYYDYRTKLNGHVMTDSEKSGQKLITLEEMREKWGEDFEQNHKRIENAVRETNGMHLVYQDQPVLAMFFSSSNGSTESSKSVWGKSFDYLVPVESPYEKALQRQRTDSYRYQWEQLSKVFGIPVRTIRQSLRVETITEGKRAATIRLSAKRTIPATKFRETLGLSSTDITIHKTPNDCLIETVGYGHGVGMSQWGAEALARKGWTASQILLHYYPGTSIRQQPVQITYNRSQIR